MALRDRAHLAACPVCDALTEQDRCAVCGCVIEPDAPRILIETWDVINDRPDATTSEEC